MYTPQHQPSNEPSEIEKSIWAIFGIFVVILALIFGPLEAKIVVIGMVLTLIGKVFVEIKKEN